MARFTEEGHLNRRQGTDGSVILELALTTTTATIMNKNGSQMPAAGANHRYAITDVWVTNQGTAGTTIIFSDTTAGNVRFTQYAGPSGAGFIIPLSKAIPMATNDTISVQLGTAPAGTVYITVNGYLETVGN